MKTQTYHFAPKKALANLAHITKYDYIPVSLATPISKKTIAMIRRRMGGTSRDISGGRVMTSRYLVDGARGKIDVYCYRKPSHKAQPAIIFFHGGGWIGGTVQAVEHFCMALADQTDTAVFSVDYSLAPEAPFPIGLEDSYLATAWLFQNAEALSIDARQISVAGDSAGGNFAIVIALLAHLRASFKLRHQILLYPVVNVTLNKNDAIDLATTLYLNGQNLRKDWRVSPVFSDKLDKLPKTLIAIGNRDSLYQSNIDFAHALERAGVDVTVLIFNNTHHAFIDDTGTTGQAEVLITQIANWLREPDMKGASMTKKSDYRHLEANTQSSMNDGSLCPICHQENHCAMVAGKDPATCWCHHTAVPQQLLEQIPPENRGISCVCKDCVDRFNERVQNT